MKKIFLFAFWFTNFFASAQNLIPNGDFEQYSTCPTGIDQLSNASFWINPTGATPDYYNQCSTSIQIGVPNNNFGFQQAHSGVAYGGIFLLFGATGSNYREYIETSLSSPLISNLCYHFEMYFNLGNNCSISTNDISVYLSDSSIANVSNSYPLPFIPQLNYTTGFFTDTLNWINVSVNYIATGGENYLTIGNFKDDLNTDSLLLNNTGHNWAYIYIDDISLILSSCTGINSPTSNISPYIYPNPISNTLVIDTKNNKPTSIILYDIASRKILEQEFINTLAINTISLSKGIYLYEMVNKDGVIKQGKLVKE